MAELIPNPTILAAEKKKTTRDAAFTPVEEATIAKTWISACEDAITSTEQKKEVFLRHVTSVYNESFKPANRPWRSFKSMKNRSKTIVKECTMFASCCARIYRNKPSGASGSDIFMLATAVYNDIETKGVNEDCGNPFKFKDSWEVLSTHGKFMARLIEVKGCSSSSSDRPKKDTGEFQGSAKREDDVGPISSLKKTSSVEEVVERPTGRKKAKEEQRRARYAENEIKLAAQSVAAEVERNTVLKRHYEIMLFTFAPAGCNDSEALEYFKTMRARTLNEICKDAKKLRLEEDDNKSEAEHRRASSKEIQTETEDEIENVDYPSK